MIPLSVAVVIFVAHFIGDYVLQTSWMAVNKSSSLKALCSHIAQYSGTLALISVWGFLAIDFTPASKALFVWILLNGLAHFVIDLITSRLGKAAKQAGKEKNFWLVIGADQLLHQLCLFGSLVLLGL